MTLIGQKRGGWRCYGESKAHRVYNGFTRTYRRLKHVTMRIACRIEDLGNVRFYRNLTVDLRHCFLIDKLQGQHKITKNQGQLWCLVAGLPGQTIASSFFATQRRNIDAGDVYRWTVFKRSHGPLKSSRHEPLRDTVGVTAATLLDQVQIRHLTLLSRRT